MNLAAGTPMWPAEWTGIGTVALAAVTVAAIITTIILTRQDRKRADKQLRQELARSAKQLDEERRLAWEREQYAEAYKVQVLQGDRSGGSPSDPVSKETSGPLRVYGAIIINGGAYTITDVDARLRPFGQSLVQFAGSERITGTRQLPDQLSDGMVGMLEAMSYGDRLAPWDVGLRLHSDPMPLVMWYPVVRWTDRWGTRWEHQRGEVWQVEESERWKP